MSRSQIADRLQELGALYAANSVVRPEEREWRSRAFLRRLVTDLRRPGFALVVAENTPLTGCAYGFPFRGGLFEIREIVVPQRVREQSPSRDWNLARRLQRRLLDDHGHATGLTLVDRTDVKALAALRSWGWRDTSGTPYGIPLLDPRCALLLGR
ncbi:hypothetical protein [Streptomyces endophyticus]|uniref:GNAT family N-acetyltransferase n=1 Tax=Streptomyces endophyticus TaxID=714166 RepID=A0ABU6EYN6_9ACTN|nr:hypothetical protein [Streptomyces endophyticus]MEB8336865.1 hypothetical protein [Streptomyces endophyticus]